MAKRIHLNLALYPHHSHPNLHSKALSDFLNEDMGGEISQEQVIMEEDRQIFWIIGSQTWFQIGISWGPLTITDAWVISQKILISMIWGVAWPGHQDFIKFLGGLSQGWEPLFQVVCILPRKEKEAMNLWSPLACQDCLMTAYQNSLGSF